jgi:inorganic pyrophosphatase
MIKHPWHEVATGKNVPAIVNAVIEIPKGSRAKYEIDKASGLIKLDRVLYGSMMYPAHYGIIPQTLFDDGDPLDILVLTQVPLVPLTLVSSRVIGVMRMIDQGVPDDKILAVAETDPSVSHIHDIEDLPQTFKDELKNFFENYTKLEGKDVQVPEFLNKKIAMKTIEHSINLYNRTFAF